MKIYNYVLGLFFLLIIGCSNDSSSDNPIITGGNNDNNFEITATPLELNVTLKNRKFVIENDEAVQKVVDWENGAGKLIITLGADKDLAEADVDENGNCNIVFPGTLKYPNVIQYIDPAGQLIGSPALFLTTYIHPLFIFKPYDNPATSDIDESEENQRLISPKLLSEDEQTVMQNYGFLMTENGTVTGTSASGNSTYNCNFKHGWNIETWNNSGEVIEHTVVDQLPTEVVWY